MKVVIHRKWGVCDVVSEPSEPMPEDWVWKPPLSRTLRSGLAKTHVTWATERGSGLLHAFVLRKRWVCVDHYFAKPTQRRWRFPSLYARSHRRASRQFLDYAYLAAPPTSLDPWPSQAAFQGPITELYVLEWLGAALAWKTLAPSWMLHTLQQQFQRQPLAQRYQRPWTLVQDCLWSRDWTWQPWSRSGTAAVAVGAPQLPAVTPKVEVLTTIRVRSSFRLDDPLALVWLAWTHRPYAPFFRLGPRDPLVTSYRRWYQFHPWVLRGARRFYASQVDPVQAEALTLQIPSLWSHMA